MIRVLLLPTTMLLPYGSSYFVSTAAAVHKAVGNNGYFTIVISNWFLATITK